MSPTKENFYIVKFDTLIKWTVKVLVKESILHMHNADSVVYLQSTKFMFYFLNNSLMKHYHFSSEFRKRLVFLFRELESALFVIDQSDYGFDSLDSDGKVCHSDPHTNDLFCALFQVTSYIWCKNIKDLIVKK